MSPRQHYYSTYALIGNKVKLIYGKKVSRDWRRAEKGGCSRASCVTSEESESALIGDFLGGDEKLSDLRNRNNFQFHFSGGSLIFGCLDSCNLLYPSYKLPLSEYIRSSLTSITKKRCATWSLNSRHISNDWPLLHKMRGLFYLPCLLVAKYTINRSIGYSTKCDFDSRNEISAVGDIFEPMQATKAKSETTQLAKYGVYE